MKIKLKAGEHLWSLEGAHICDERGFAKVAEEDCEIEVEDGERVLAIIKSNRELNGLDPETGLPPVVIEPQDQPE